jgi:hypothetical protein
VRIAQNLRGIISQRLVPTVEAASAPPMEVMINTPRIQDLIIKQDLSELRNTIEQGSKYQMRTFDQALIELYEKGKISAETAIEYADSKNNVSLHIRLNKGDDFRRWTWSSTRSTGPRAPARQLAGNFSATASGRFRHGASRKVDDDLAEVLLAFLVAERRRQLREGIAAIDDRLQLPCLQGLHHRALMLVGPDGDAGHDGVALEKLGERHFAADSREHADHAIVPPMRRARTDCVTVPGPPTSTTSPTPPPERSRSAILPHSACSR